MKPNVKRSLLGLIACVVILVIILIVFGKQESGGSKNIVNLGVVCVIGIFYYLIILLTSIFSKK